MGLHGIDMSASKTQMVFREGIGNKGEEYGCHHMNVRQLTTGRRWSLDKGLQVFRMHDLCQPPPSVLARGTRSLGGSQSEQKCTIDKSHTSIISFLCDPYHVGTRIRPKS